MSGNKKKVVIKPWRPQSQWNRAKAEQTMEALRQAINEIHNQNASLLSFEELYRNAYYLVLHKYGRMLYDGVGEQIAAHLQETVKAIVAAPDDMLLAAVKRDWGAHTINMEMIRDILMYMDRTFVLKENLTKVYDLGLKTFRREVLHHKQVQNRLVKQILANIHSERCGELIDHALIKNIIDMLVHLGIDSREVYIDIFERPFLRDSAQFYSQESRDFILENTCPAYVAKAHARLKEEADRVTRCLHASTKRRLLEIVERELILQHAQTLVEMENSGCVAMFRDDKIQDLRDLYNLFLRVPKTLEIIMNALSSCIITTGDRKSVV